MRSLCSVTSTMDSSEVMVATAPETREDHRARWDRQAWKTTKAGLAARVVSIGVRMLTIPIALRLLGPERYGLWLTISSLITWFGFASAGFGSALINALSAETARDDRLAMQRHVSTVIFSLLVIGIIIIAASALLSQLPGMVSLLGIGRRADLQVEARELIVLAGLIFAGSLALDFTNSLSAGLQEGYFSSLATVSASAITLIWVLLLPYYRIVAVRDYVFAVGLPPVITSVLVACYLLYRKHPFLRPSWRLWSRKSFSGLMGFGGWMFIGLMGDLVIFQSANVLIANQFGPARVPRYAVAASVFQNVAALSNGIVYPYWAAFTEASARRDWAWINSVMYRMLKRTVGLMAGAGLVMVLFGRELIRLWAGESAVPETSLLVAMAVYFTLAAWAANNIVLLLGLGHVRTKALLTAWVAVAQLAGFFLLSHTFGVVALPLTAGAAVLIECVIASFVIARYRSANTSLLEH